MASLTGTIQKAWATQDGPVRGHERFPDNSISYPVTIDAGGLTPEQLEGLPVRSVDGALWTLTKRAAA